MQRPEEKRKREKWRTRVASNHASYVRHASKILGWIKNACFRLVCGPLRTPLIYRCLPVANERAPTRESCARNTHTYASSSVWLPCGNVSNGTHEHTYVHSRTRRSQIPFYHLTDHPPSPIREFVGRSDEKRESLLFLRTLRFSHTRGWFGSTKCRVCANQSLSCVELHPGNQSNFLDAAAVYHPKSKALFYRFKMRQSSLLAEGR